MQQAPYCQIANDYEALFPLDILCCSGDEAFLSTDRQQTPDAASLLELIFVF